MDSDEDGYDIVEDTFGATYTTLRFIIDDHEHTLLHATTPQTAALINTLRHQFAEHIRTTLYNIRTYALHQQAVLRVRAQGRSVARPEAEDRVPRRPAAVAAARQLYLVL